MEAHVYEGYFENGVLYNSDREIVKIPDNYKVSVLLFNEVVNEPSKKPFGSLFGEWSGQISMSDDFDESLEEMGEYM